MTLFTNVIAVLCLIQVHGTPDVTAEEAHQHLLASAPSNHVGKNLHCFGNRAHEVSYNVDPKAESLKKCTACVVTVKPSPDMNHVCGPKLTYNSGCDPLKGKTKDCPWQNITKDYDVCFGANVAKGCNSAKKSLSLGGHWSCSNCFVGLAFDLHIEIIYINSFTRLRKDLGIVEIKVSNTHLNGNLELKASTSSTRDIIKGDLKLPNTPQVTAYFSVGTLPVKVDVSVPTTLSYSATATVEGSFSAGVGIDLQFTDSSARWVDRDNSKSRGGITAVKGKFKSFSVTPKLLSARASMSMKFELALKTGLEVEITEIMSYRVNVVPKIVSNIVYPLFPYFGRRPCISSSANLDVSHEADVHFPGGVFFPDKTIISWGPGGLFSRSKELYKKCFRRGTEAMVV